MKMYMKNGYVNMRDIIHSLFTFIFGVGARGIGKSYNCWETIIDDSISTGKKFIYLRITEDEIDTVCTAESNPIDVILKYKGKTEFKPINKHMKGIYLDEKLIGICASLRTFAKVRGMSFEDYSVIFFDEFIREAHQNKLKKLGEALKQLYETVNRNRELEGEAPVKLICMSNALDFNNDILIEFNIIEAIRSMKRSGQEFYFSPAQSLMVIYPQRSPISSKKKETALYKLEGGSYSKMALDNEFREFFEGNVRSCNLKGFKPMFIFGSMCFYRSVNSDRTWYVTETRKGNFIEIYNDTHYEKIAFLKKHIRLHDYYFLGKISFETAKLELEFTNLIEC